MFGTTRANLSTRLKK